MKKKRPSANKENIQDIPGFIYKGAVVDLRGNRQVIKDVRNEGGRLMLGFAGGLEEAFNPNTVHEVPGSIPAFLHEGAILRVTNKNSRRFGMPPVLDWEVSSFDVAEDEQGKQRLHVTLKHGKPSRRCMAPFNPRTMAPVPVEDPVTLKSEITLKKPLQFRPK